jgi:hypothetical protein
MVLFSHHDSAVSLQGFHLEVFAINERYKNQILEKEGGEEAKKSRY